jgi:hypothetical protein
MMRTYAAELDGDGVVRRVICGTADWAIEHLGGTWFQPDGLVGIGWVFDGENIVLPEPDPEPDDDDLDPDA